ncbi:potassium channel family protein [Actinomycetospora chiangmaiensis]|uniref:potassium channel family protein n=1 Tax=Actinomycetospora chiangmaiensis TaxID=402650 RepID=UPI0003A82143|nr:potassium channel family protein [Actinomycetospora chiangmaiensis]
MDEERGAAIRRAVGAAVRSTVTVAVMGWLYAVLPLTARPDALALAELTIGLLAFAGAAVWQVRAISRSRWPVLRAVEAFAVIAPLFVLIFATTYVVLAASEPGSFDQALDRVGALYFTVTVLATVGFGDIVPVTAAARLLVVGQMVLDLVLIGTVVRAMLGAVETGRTRNQR